MDMPRIIGDQLRDAGIPRREVRFCRYQSKFQSVLFQREQSKSAFVPTHPGEGTRMDSISPGPIPIEKQPTNQDKACMKWNQDELGRIMLITDVITSCPPYPH
jgi:hypothetical protein